MAAPKSHVGVNPRFDERSPKQNKNRRVDAGVTPEFDERAVPGKLKVKPVGPEQATETPRRKDV